MRLKGAKVRPLQYTYPILYKMIRSITLSVLLLLTTSSLILGQTTTSDSLKIALTKANKPIERFDILNRLILDLVGWKGDNVDSTYCVEMVQIAQ